jgi:hypothetical protein
MFKKELSVFFTLLNSICNKKKYTFALETYKTRFLTIANHFKF